MNVLAQVVGVALNVLMTPFNPSAPAMPYIVSESTCRTTVFKLGKEFLEIMSKVDIHKCIRHNRIVRQLKLLF